MSKRAPLKVVIVGGGIGGLVLANCLQHTNIDFVVIEKRERLDPDTGASIGILPNGARILDQIDCYKDLLEATASMKTSGSHRHDGSLIGSISDSLQLMHVRYVSEIIKWIALNVLMSYENWLRRRVSRTHIVATYSRRPH